MADSDTIGALLVAAKTFLTGEGLSASSISWENRVFNPVGKTPWAAVFVVPNTPQPVTLGNQGTDRGDGFMQIDLNIPFNTGDSVLRTWEDAARAFFIVGSTFTQGGQIVRVLSCGMSQGRKVDNWFRKSLTIAYRTDFQRNLIT
jgi:hypothetical protein